EGTGGTKKENVNETDNNYYKHFLPPGPQAPHPVCHSGSGGHIPLGFDRILDEVSNEFFFYGSSHPHHHEEMFVPAELFSQHVPDQHLYSHPLVAHGELYPGSPVPHWQQGSVAPMVGFRPSSVPDCRNFSVVDSQPYSQEREPHGRNSVNSVSNVERGNSNLEFQIGFDNLGVPSPAFLENYPFGQKVREESGNGEASVTNTSGRCSTGPLHPQGSGHTREVIKCSYINSA
uniref:Uncharacterized protein n=1 Tax=Serinus canaria TaxID=9135 RepID=A0A8C9MVG3_SERCA